MSYTSKIPPNGSFRKWVVVLVGFLEEPLEYMPLSSTIFTTSPELDIGRPLGFHHSHIEGEGRSHQDNCP